MPLNTIKKLMGTIHANPVLKNFKKQKNYNQCFDIQIVSDDPEQLISV